jgi:hypothetical protein
MAAMADGRTAKLIDQLGDFRTRAAARRQLLELPECPAEDLLALVEDSEAPVNKRWAGITVLAQHKVEDAVRPLVRVMREEYNLIDEAAVALAAITGKDCGQRVEDWEEALGLAPPAGTEVDGAAVAAGGGAGITDLSRDNLMATVRRAVGERVARIDWDEAGYVNCEVSVGERKQQVLIAPGEVVGIEPDQLLVYTECGSVGGVEREELLRQIPSPQVGELAISEDDGRVSIALRHAVGAADLDDRRLGFLVMTVAEYSDRVEAQLTGKDRV